MQTTKSKKDNEYSLMTITDQKESQASPCLAVIVPAYNEAGRVGEVVRTLKSLEELDEILVIDDGSKDGTAEDALRAAGNDKRIRVIRHPQNRGKGAAMFTGLAATRAPTIVMVDADLIHLQPEHVRDLISPVIQGEADMTLGLFHNGYWRTDTAHMLTPWLTGQRCLRAELFNQLSMEAAAGYGFETALTLAAGRGNWRVKKVPLTGVTHLAGDIPRGWRGPVNKAHMYAHIGRAWLVTQPWSDLVKRTGRRIRFGLVLALAFGASIVNSCSVSTSALEKQLFTRWMSDDSFRLFIHQLKSAFDLLQ